MREVQERFEDTDASLEELVELWSQHLGCGCQQCASIRSSNYSLDVWLLAHPSAHPSKLQFLLEIPEDEHEIASWIFEILSVLDFPEVSTEILDWISVNMPPLGELEYTFYESLSSNRRCSPEILETFVDLNLKEGFSSLDYSLHKALVQVNSGVLQVDSRLVEEIRSQLEPKNVTSETFSLISKISTVGHPWAFHFFVIDLWDVFVSYFEEFEKGKLLGRSISENVPEIARRSEVFKKLVLSVKPDLMD